MLLNEFFIKEKSGAILIPSTILEAVFYSIWNIEKTVYNGLRTESKRDHLEK